MARPRKLSDLDLVQNRIKELKEMTTPEYIANLKKELAQLEDAARHLGTVELLILTLKPKATRKK